VLTPAAKEKALGVFHQLLITNHQAITTITDSAQLTSFLSLMLIERSQKSIQLFIFN